MEPNPKPSLPQEKKPPIGSPELKEFLRSLGFKDDQIEFDHSLSNLPTEEKQKIFEHVFYYFKSLDNKQKGALKHLIEEGKEFKVDSFYDEALKDFSINISDALRGELESSIKKCSSFDELYEILNTAKGIKGTKFYYNSEKVEALKTKINEYRMSPRDNLSEEITMAEGIRNKAQELKKLSPKPVETPIPEVEKIPEEQAPIMEANEEIKPEVLEEVAPIIQTESEQTQEVEPPVVQVGETSKIPEGEPISPGTRVIDAEPVPEIPVEPVSVAQTEKVLNWKESEEWKELEKAREEYAKEEIKYEKYEEEIGDYLNTQEAYKSRKKVIAEMIRNEIWGNPDTVPTAEQEAKLNAKINDTIFEELVKKENDAYLNVLREARGETLKNKALEKAKNLLSNKAVKWYLGLSKVQRMAINFGIGSVAGLAFGATVAPGAIGAASYLAWRAARATLSGTAGAYAGEWANKRWSAEELKKAEEKETEDLKNSDISLEQKSEGFKDIQQRYKKERVKMTLKKMSTTVVAGAGTGFLTGLAEHAMMGMGGTGRAAVESGGGKSGGMPDRMPPRQGFEPPPTRPQAGPVAPAEHALPPKASIITEPTSPKISVAPETSQPAIPEPIATSAEKIFSDPSLLKHEVVAGDSTWKILEKTLDSNEQFKGMTEAQKTYVLSTMTNKVLEHPGDYGVGKEGVINIGDKTDFTKLFENTKEVKSILDKAKETIAPGSAQEHSILDNNAKIADWVKENPNVRVTNDKVAEILATKPKVLVVPEPEVAPEAEILPESDTDVEPYSETYYEPPVVSDTPAEPSAETYEPDVYVDTPAPEGAVQQQQLEAEIAEHKQQLQTLQAKAGIRSLKVDGYEYSSVKEAMTNGVNSFYDKHGVFGFGTVGGVNTSEWKFMSKLPANKVLEYYTHDSPQSGLSAKVIEELSKSPKHDAFVKGIVNGIEQSNGMVKPFENENVEQFVERLTGFVLKNTPKPKI